MLKRLLPLTLPVALTLAACSQHSVSGAYLGTAPGYIAVLQLTETRGGQVQGPLSIYIQLPNGSMKEFDFSVSGSTDGKTIALVEKAADPLSNSGTVSGTIDSSGAITINGLHGSMKLEPTTPDEYHAKVAELTKQGEAIALAGMQQQAIERTRKDADALRAKLLAFTAKMSQANAMDSVTATHNKMLDAASKDLGIEQTFPKASYPASQVDFRIGEIDFQLHQFDMSWGNSIAQGRDSVQKLDAAAAAIPCAAHANLDACVALKSAEDSYAVSKGRFLANLQDIEAASARDEAKMKAIHDQADAYTH